MTKVQKDKKLNGMLEAGCHMYLKDENPVFYLAEFIITDFNAQEFTFDPFK